jgi:phosphoribosylaminoimidazole (AIR) synthetase
MDEEYRLADALLLPSQNYLASFQGHGITEEKLRVIEQGVDTDIYKPSRKSEQIFSALSSVDASASGRGFDKSSKLGSLRHCRILSCW